MRIFDLKSENENLEVAVSTIFLNNKFKKLYDIRMNKFKSTSNYIKFLVHEYYSSIQSLKPRRNKITVEYQPANQKFILLKLRIDGETWAIIKLLACYLKWSMAKLINYLMELDSEKKEFKNNNFNTNIVIPKNIKISLSSYLFIKNKWENTYLVQLFAKLV